MKKLFTLILAFWISSSFAQENENPQWMQYANGKEITAIAGEGDFLWIGTSTGLVKLNKITNQKVFYNCFNSGLPLNKINAIAIDNEGIKWFGTRKGLASFDGSTWTTYNESNSDLVYDNVAQIVIDENNVKWLSSYSRLEYGGTGLTSFDGSEWNNYLYYNSGLPTDLVTSIALDQEGFLWIGTDQALVTFNGLQWTIITSLNSGLPCNFITSITVDENNRKWIGCSSREKSYLVEYYNEQWIVYEVPQSEDIVNDVLQTELDEDNGIWLNTRIGLFFKKLSDTSWIKYDASNSGLPDTQVCDILIDDGGGKWFGTMEGLISFDGTSWELLNTSSCIMPSNQTYIVKCNNQTKLIGTNKGLVYLDNIHWRVYDSSNSPLTSDDILDIAIDKEGTAWMASGWFCLAALKNGNWTIYDTLNSGLSESFKNIEVDKQGRVWMAYKKLQLFDGSNWKEYEIPNIGPHDRINHMAIEGGNKIWLTSTNSNQPRIFSFDGNTWMEYNTQNSGLQSGYIEDFDVDKDGRKWIVRYNGLTVFDGVTWKVYNSQNSGLPYDYVDEVDVDENGNAWFGMMMSWNKGSMTEPMGIACFDGTRWISYYDIPFHATSFSIDKDGTSWIGTDYQGLIAHNPNGVPLSKPNQIVIKDTKIRLYPNPVTHDLFIETPEKGTLSIINPDGKLLAQKPTDGNKSTMDVRKLSLGLYILRYTNAKCVENVKFVKR